MAKKNEISWHLHPRFIGLVLLFLFVSTVVVAYASRSNNPTDKGFDELGYNRSARIFQGKADGVDGALDGLAYGSPVYANDNLKMKWNAEWDRGNAENWANPPYDAWIDNNWNGSVPNGSNEVWQYKIKWVGPCGADGTELANGGYCLWGQFEVVLSHGTAANEHFWDAHAVPAGFGN